MKRLWMIGILAALLLCSGCGKQAEQGEVTRVLFARGHGSTWGNQFRMDVCPTEVSYTHFFGEGEKRGELQELFAVPIEEARWEEIETALMAVLPQLEVKKSPGLLERIGSALKPPTVDGGKWAYLTVTRLVGDEPKEIEYVWKDTPDTEAFVLLLEELAHSLEK